MFVHNPCDGGFELYSQSTKKKLLEDSDFDFDCLFLKDWLPDFLVFNQSSSFN